MKKLILLVIFLLVPSATLAQEATTTPEVATSTPEIATSTVSTSSPQAVVITIRSGDTAAFTGVVDLAASTSPAIDIAPTNSSSTVAVSADSLLATLIALDATTADFNITDLAYFSSFDSFLINCIEIPAASRTDCFNWTYAVNGSYPQIGVDDQLLRDGDIVHLFFGPPRQTILSTTTAAIGESFTATAQSYNLDSGQYVGAPGVTLGVGISNPDFTFTELATSTSDAVGQALFVMSATGTYSVGIAEDFYFPTASITIFEVATSSDESEEEAASTPPTPPPSVGGGGGISHSQLNVQTALAYLASTQNADGSFASSLLTDWAALAFAAFDPSNALAEQAKTSLRNYLLTTSPVLSSTTDYERHAMALMALGINPYSDTLTDYIAHIISAFDGNQIGEASLDNDDIFALFPLTHAGYSASDNIIQKTAAFIIVRQQASGAWDGSVDMTAAAIQALAPLNSLGGVSAAIAKAEQYLHTQQQQNGGWSNSFSTSWASQAIAALGENVSDWSPVYNPNDYLASLQQPDGGIEPVSSDAQTRVWATEYAIPASLGKTWNSLLSSFPKPAGNTNAGGEILGVATSTSSWQATSTTENATTTLLTATSTPTDATSTVQTVPEATTTPKISGNNVDVSKIATFQSGSRPLRASGKETPTNKTTSTTSLAASPTLNQTAASVGGGGNLLSTLWRAITSFFAWFF